jgi:UDP-N-acetylglucosamine 4-epimerase
LAAQFRNSEKGNPVTTYEQARRRIAREPRSWLVSGAAGFIGSHLVEHLLGLEQEVVGLDNFSTGKRENLDLVRRAVGEARWKSFRFIEGDIRSLEACNSACASVDIVLHQAGLGSVPRSIDRPLRTHEANVNGFLNMLLAARDAGARRFVYASSSAVYGDHAALPKVESEIGRAMSPYGLSKRINELYADVFAACYGFQSIGLRYFNVFGPRQDPDGPYASVIPAWLGALLRGETAYINGDGACARDYCHVDNVVQANLLSALIEDEQAIGQAYNVAVGEQATLLELFEIMRSQLAGRLPHLADARAVHRAPRRGDMLVSRADIGKAARLLGYRPVHDLRSGLAQTIDWYIAHLARADERGLVHV